MKNKMNISRIVYFACTIMICLFIISVCCVNSVLAKYTTKNDSNESASVAKFDVDITTTSTSECYSIPYSEMAPGSEMVITIKINVNTEIAVTCNIDVSSLGMLPLDLELSKTSFELVAGTYSFEETLKISWDENETNYKYSEEIDIILLNVSVVQKD